MPKTIAKVTVPLPIAMRDFFGLRQGQKLKDFADELKALSDDDKAFFADALKTKERDIVVEQ